MHYLLHRLTAILGFIFCLNGKSVGSTLVLYGGTASGGSHEFELVEIDLADGSTTSRGDGRFWTGLDFTLNGASLFGVSSRLYTIDTTTGSESEVGPLSLLGSEAILMKSMTISPTGEVFVLSNGTSDPSGTSRLYTVDPDSGNLSLIGTPSVTIFGLEFGFDGTLYGAFGSLYELDPTDASTVRSIGSLGPDIFVTELDFSSNGLLGIDPAADSSTLYQIDQSGTTGALATPISTISSDVVRSIASVPEPDVSLLTVAGLLGLCWRRRARSRRTR